MFQKYKKVLIQHIHSERWLKKECSKEKHLPSWLGTGLFQERILVWFVFLGLLTASLKQLSEYHN